MKLGTSPPTDCFSKVSHCLRTSHRQGLPLILVRPVEWAYEEAMGDYDGPSRIDHSSMAPSFSRKISYINCHYFFLQGEFSTCIGSDKEFCGASVLFFN